jgi:hypothetical protein
MRKKKRIEMKIYDLVDEFNSWNLLPSSAEFDDDIYLDPYFDEDEDMENKLQQLRSIQNDGNNIINLGAKLS